MEEQTIEQNQTVDNETAAIPARKFNRKAVWVTAIVVVVLAVLVGLGFAFKSTFVAATVNGQIISRMSVIKELEKQGGKSVLDSLINKKLLENEFKAKGLVVKQEDINAEIKRYEDEFNVNGNTLDKTLEAQGMTRDDLTQQIIIQKEVEMLLGDKANVTDEEVNKYIADNKIPLTQGQEEQNKQQIKESLRQQKLGQGSTELLATLKAKAKINRFVNY